MNAPTCRHSCVAVDEGRDRCLSILAGPSKRTRGYRRIGNPSRPSPLVTSAERPPPNESSRTVAASRRLFLQLISVGFRSVDGDLNSAVLLPTGVGAVVVERFGLTAPRCAKTGTLHALAGEIGGGRLRAPLGERLVVTVASQRVRVSDDQEIRLGILLETGREISQVL